MLLSQLQQSLEKIWKGMRWTMDIISYARDKNVSGGVTLDVMYRAVPESHSPDIEQHRQIAENNNSLSSYQVSEDASNQISVGKDKRKIAKFFDPSEDSRTQGEGMEVPGQSGILRIYAAYDTGLARGTSVKLHVTAKTTAREVINLVVQQLNRVLRMKGRAGPIYTDEHYPNFCLVTVLGARERVLRDDFQPLLLQSPWTRGKLYIRMRNNVLAAIQHGQATAVWSDRIDNQA